MIKLAKYLKPYRLQCTIGPICKLAEAILELLLPTIMAFVIDEGVIKGNADVVYRLGALMILMVFIGFGCSMICQYNAALASQGFGTDMRNRMFDHITSFAYRDIDHFTSASLTNRLTNDVNQLQIAVAMLIRLVIRSPFICIGAVGMAMLLDFQLSLILLAAMPFIAMVLYFFIFKSTPLFQAYQRKLDQFAVRLDDNLAGVRVIRAFVKQQKEKEKCYASCDELQLQMMRISKLSAVLNPLNALIVNTAIVILLHTGILQISAGTTAPGTLIAFINYANQILIAMIAVSNLVVIFTKAAASAQRVNEVLDYVPSMNDGTDVLTGHGNEVLRFDDVSFSYGDGKAALSHLQFRIHKEETIGIIRGTGSGKSTLAQLLGRFYEASEGVIFLYGQDIRTCTSRSLQEHVTLVPQANEIFSGTLRNNLLLGRQAKEEELYQALETAQALDFVKALPEGLDTILERGGTNLSGGQRQRVCIARALLRCRDILILDDASSALDQRTDAQLRHALQQMKGITRIMISQRAGTLLHCDRILVLDNGQLAGFASHQELLSTCEIYREICATQNLGGDVHENI